MESLGRIDGRKRRWEVGAKFLLNEWVKNIEKQTNRQTNQQQHQQIKKLKEN